MKYFFGVALFSLLTADVVDIERDAVQQRRQIHSGEVVVRARYRDERRFPNGREVYLRIWWDGSSFRQDMHLGNYREVDIWTEGRYLHWSDEPGTTGNKLIATIAHDRDEGVVGSRQRHDPRRIGFGPSNFLNLVNYPIDEFLGNPARIKTTTQKVNHDGNDCTEVAISRINGATVRAWIAPERGMNILRMVVVSAGEEELKLVDAVDVSASLHEPSGIWFPTRFHYQRSAGDQAVEQVKTEEEEEEGTVEIISLNEPIPPEVFTFAGVGVPIGWPVSDRTRPDVSGPLAWDGKSAVSVEHAADTARAATRVSFVYLFGAALLALVGAVLMWRVLFRRVTSQ